MTGTVNNDGNGCSCIGSEKPRQQNKRCFIKEIKRGQQKRCGIMEEEEDKDRSRYEG